jgi:hypothetical protein
MYRAVVSLLFNGLATSQRGTAMNPSTANAYELRFRSMFEPGRGYAFPCDAAGCVELDALSDRVRNNYLYARAVVGRELAAPAVQPLLTH